MLFYEVNIYGLASSKGYINIYRYVEILSCICIISFDWHFHHHLVQMVNWLLQGNKILWESSDVCWAHSDNHVSCCNSAHLISCPNRPCSLDICQQETHQSHTPKPKRIIMHILYIKTYLKSYLSNVKNITLLTFETIAW